MPYKLKQIVLCQGNLPLFKAFLVIIDNNKTMNISVLVMLIVSLSAFKSVSSLKIKNKDKVIDSKYLYVERIDSVIKQVKIIGDTSTKNYEGVYVIYARQKEKLYKIVSERHKSTYRKCIFVGEYYCFQLESLFAQEPGKPVDLGLAQTDGFIINGVSIEKEKETTYDIFYDERLENLCFKLSNKKGN